MTYVDGFILPVPEDKIEDYRKMAEDAGKLWMEHGALSYKECVMEDNYDSEFCSSFLKSFPNRKENEIIIFSFITYKSRQHRDEVNDKVMKDERLKCDPNNMPFDAQRMAYGGFKAIVDF